LKIWFWIPLFGKFSPIKQTLNVILSKWWLAKRRCSQILWCSPSDDYLKEDWAKFCDVLIQVVIIQKKI
jgi:hypothetical protein